MFGSFLPKDATPEEIKISVAMTIEVYRKLDNVLDKLIVSMVYENGYSLEDVAQATDKHYSTIYAHNEKLKRKLAEAYNISGFN